MKINEQWYGDSQANELATLAREALGVDGYYMEIGAWQGVSTSYILRAIKPRNLLVIDTWRGNEDESAITGVEHSSVTIARARNVYQEFLDNMQSEQLTNFVPYRMSWQSFFDTVWCADELKCGEDGIAFLHIDASHDYCSVKECIERALPFMVSGGIMCGDDYLTAADDRLDLQGGVMRAVKETLPAHTHINNLWIWKCI